MSETAACGYCDRPRSMTAREARCGFPSNHAPLPPNWPCRHPHHIGMESCLHRHPHG